MIMGDYMHIYPSSAQVPVLKVELGRLLAATLQFSGRRNENKVGGCAFVIAGPAAWNRLLLSVRNSPSLDSFKTAPKTLIFFFTADI